MNKGGRPPIELASKHSVEELKAHYRASTCAVERRRIQVLWWLVEGKSREEVMALSAYSKPSVREIIKRYNAEGLAGLRDKRHENEGAPSLLSDDELLLLAQVVRDDYSKGIVWDGAKVVQWLREEVGKEVYVSRAYEALAQLGFSRQSARPRHCQADVIAQEAFKKNAA